MRIISGTKRGMKLAEFEGMDIRPTTDRVRESVFNLIQGYVRGAVVLDLFAGSGGIGIEALSRGAREAVFVEKNPKAMECVKENLKFTRLEKKGLTLTKDVMNALYQLEGEKVFDFVFMDPPYNMGFEKRVLEYLAGSDLIYEDTVIIVEASLDTDFGYLQELGYSLIKEKRYKTNKHVFIEKAGKEEVC